MLDDETLESWWRPAMHRRLVAFARRFVGDAGEAEDVAQEALLRAGRGRERLRRRGRAEAWLFRICRHAAIDHVRARRVRRGVWASPPEELADRVPAPARPEPSPVPALPLEAVPAQHRLLVELHYRLGLTQARLCGMTGLSSAALRVRLYRARRALLEVCSAVKSTPRDGR